MQINHFSQNQPIKKTPAFGATIHLMDETSFNRVLKQLPDCFFVGKKWTMEEAAINKTSAYTIMGRDCFVSSIFNPESKLVNAYHLAPNKENMSKINMITDTIYEQALKLKNNSKKKLEGFITATDNSRRKDGLSYEFFTKIENAYEHISEELGMDYSVLAGRYDTDSQISLISDAASNTHYLRTESPLIETTSPFKSSLYFQTKRLYPNDTFIIRGKDVTEKFREISSKNGIITNIIRWMYLFT